MNNNNYRMQQPPPSVPVTGYPAPPYQNGGGQQYPYVAYPQQAPLYYNNNNNNNNNNAPFATRSFFRAFIGTMICLIIIFSIILLITFLVLRPSFPSFQLTSISISDFNTSSQLLSATWHISFLTFNRNKKISVTYNALRSAIFYRSYFLTDSQLPPFKAETMSENTINATLALSQTYVEPFVIRGLNTDINQRGSITFDVQLISATSFHSGSWRFRSLLLKVLCEDVSISISSNATSANANFIHGPPKCQVWS